MQRVSPVESHGRVMALDGTVNDVEHIESQSLQGIGIVKIYFHPTVNIQTATAQVTLLLEFPEIAALNCSDLPGSKSALAGNTLSVTPDTMMIPTLATSFAFACDTAVTVTCDGFGTVFGAV